MSALLSVSDAHVSYGKVEAVRSVSLDVADNEIVTIIGANGAGKSTLLNAIMGVLPLKGVTAFAGMDMAPLDIEDRVAAGLCLVPEHRELFGTMNVEDNLLLGAFRIPKATAAQSFEKVYALFPRLKERRKQLAGTLSGGEQQMLAMGRALMGAPKLLMLDEPSLGLAPIIVADIFRTIGELRAAGVSVLLVEQNARAALRSPTVPMSWNSANSFCPDRQRTSPAISASRRAISVSSTMARAGSRSAAIGLRVPTEVVDEDVHADQEDPERQYRETPADEKASHQQDQCQQESEKSDPARSNAGTDHDGRRGDHEYGSHLDRVHVRDNIRSSTREAKGGRIHQLLRRGNRSDQHNRAYYGGGGKQHRQEQQAAPEKHGGEKAILKLGEPVAQHADKPKEGDTSKRHQVQRHSDRSRVGGKPRARLKRICRYRPP